MSEKTPPIIELGRGSDSIRHGNGKDSEGPTVLHIDDIYSLEPTAAGILKVSKPLHTLGKHFKAFGNSNSKDAIPGIGMIATAIKAGIEKNDYLSHVFVHGNHAESSMHEQLGERKEMTEEERLEIKDAILDFSAHDLKEQSQAQMPVPNNPDFGPNDPYANTTVKDYLDKDEIENIALNDREKISTPTFNGM